MAVVVKICVIGWGALRRDLAQIFGPLVVEVAIGMSEECTLDIFSSMNVL